MKDEKNNNGKKSQARLVPKRKKVKRVVSHKFSK
jgi:hypothetical protein